MNRKLKIEAIDMAITPNLRARIEARIRPLLVGDWDEIDRVTVTVEKISQRQGDAYFCRIQVALENGISVASEIVSTDLEAAIRSASENVRFSTTDMLRSRRSGLAGLF